MLGLQERVSPRLRLVLFAVVIGLLSIAEVVLTYVGLSKGCSELNPLFVLAGEQWMVVKVGITLVVVLAFDAFKKTGMMVMMAVGLVLFVIWDSVALVMQLGGIK